MKRFDLKSLAAGIIIGTVGVTTVLAATAIQSAAASDVNLTLKGEPLALGKPLISVVLEEGQKECLYAPVEELLEKLGYGVYYDSAENRIDLIPGGSSLEGGTDGSLSREDGAGRPLSQGDTAISLANHAGQRNISESGAFQAGSGQTMSLSVTSDIKGGTVDLFLFDPRGQEQRITIGAGDMKKEIVLEEGVWRYNCSGIFVDGGDIEIVGIIR